MGAVTVINYDLIKLLIVMGKRENGAERRLRREKKAESKKMKDIKAKQKEQLAAQREKEEDIDAILKVWTCEPIA